MPVTVGDVAAVREAPEPKRGTASYKTRPAVILSVQKQPDANTLALTRDIDRMLDDLARTPPEGRRDREGELPPGRLHRGRDPQRDGGAARRRDPGGGRALPLPGQPAHDPDLGARHAAVAGGRRPDDLALRRQPQHHDPGRPDDRHRRPGRRRHHRRRERLPPPAPGAGEARGRPPLAPSTSSSGPPPRCGGRSSSRR